MKIIKLGLVIISSMLLFVGCNSEKDDMSTENSELILPYRDEDLKDGDIISPSN